jgi:hypothetical protein
MTLSICSCCVVEAHPMFITSKYSETETDWRNKKIGNGMLHTKSPQSTDVAIRVSVGVWSIFI